MLNVLFTTVEWMSSITDTAGSTRASSSTTSSVDVNVEPARCIPVDLDAHEAVLEEPCHDFRPHHARLVHAPHVRRHLAGGEPRRRLAHHLLLLEQRRHRLRRRHVLGVLRVRGEPRERRRQVAPRAGGQPRPGSSANHLSLPGARQVVFCRSSRSFHGDHIHTTPGELAMVSTSLLCAAALLSAALGSLVPPPLSRRALFAAAAGLPALTQLPASALAAGGALSEDAVKQLISQIPLFAVTNKASQPYLTDASEDGIRTGFFFLDPKEALDELRNVRSAAGAPPTHPAARGCSKKPTTVGTREVATESNASLPGPIAQPGTTLSPTDRGGRATRARAPHAARAHLRRPARR